MNLYVIFIIHFLAKSYQLAMFQEKTAVHCRKSGLVEFNWAAETKRFSKNKWTVFIEHSHRKMIKNIFVSDFEKRRKVIHKLMVNQLFYIEYYIILVILGNVCVDCIEFGTR